MADAVVCVTCYEGRAYGALPETRDSGPSATIHYGRVTIRSDMGPGSTSLNRAKQKLAPRRAVALTTRASQERCASMHRSG